MTGLDIFALMVLGVLVATALGLFALLGLLPGRVARQREHPQAEAIGIASWLALIFDFGDALDADLLPSVGTGLRYQVTKKTKVNLRLDVAFGEDGDPEIYFGIGESS